MPTMRRAAALVTLWLLAGLCEPGPLEAWAQTDPTAGSAQIGWDVKSGLAAVPERGDFLRHVAADRGDGVLGAEDRLARDSDGRGWATDLVGSLCVDALGQP